MLIHLQAHKLTCLEIQELIFSAYFNQFVGTGGL